MPWGNVVRTREIDSIEPDWVRDLLSRWSAGGIGGEECRRGYRSVSPMFFILGVSEDYDGDESYSTMEVMAVRKAIEIMHEERPLDWAQINAAFKPWAAGGVVVDEGRLKSACLTLANMVDEMMGGF